MNKSLRGKFRHAVAFLTTGAFLFSSFLFPATPIIALEGGTSGSTPPPTPTNLSGTATTTPSPKVSLTWQQPPAGEFSYPPTRYVIYRVAGNSPNFSGTTPLAYTPDTNTAYDDTTVSYGTYNYKVAGQRVTVDGSGFPQISESSNSNMYTVTLTAPTSTPTSTPTPTSTNPSPVISASLSGDQKTATVTWAPLMGAISYRGYRKLPGGTTFEFLGQYSSSTTQFSEPNLVVNAGVYTYKLQASFSSGSDTESNEAYVNPQVNIPPTGGGGGSNPLVLLITATTKSSSQIDVTWPFVPDALFYYVYGGTNQASLTKVGNGAPGPTAVSFEHKTLSPGTTYYYRVEAYNGAGLLVTSNVASATTLSEPTPPPTPPTSTTSTPPITQPVSSITDECGSNDRLSPVRITDPNSGVKFTQLPSRALFKPGENPTFTYCFRNTLNHQVQVKVRRSLVNNTTLREYASSIGTVVLQPAGNPTKADRFSFNRNQTLERTIPLGEYRLRVQIIDETETAVGDEKLPIALNQVDENSFIFLVDNDQPLPPPDPVTPPPLLKPSDPTSDIKFTQFPSQNTFWAGQGMRVSFTYKNNSGADQYVTLACSLLDSEGNLIDQQRASLPRLRNRQSIKLTSGKGCVLPGIQPLSLLLPTGYYTFRAEVYDKETDLLITENSFNFRVVKRR